MKPEHRIVSELAEAVCKRVARQTRTALTQMTDCRLSGEDSPLANTWDEYCVQVQGEDSVFWSAYKDIISAIVGGFVGKLERFEIEAIWFQTEEGSDWLYDQGLLDPPSKARPAFDESSVVDFIIQEHISPMADNWSNKRIRDYIDSGYGD
jgi:hypothetical protein